MYTMNIALELSRRERNELCLLYEQQLQGPMQQQELAIKCAKAYFSNIPKSERTPELSALEELFSDVVEGSLRESLLEDLETMKESTELQDAMLFDFQHIIYVQACRFELYYSLAHKAAVRFGFSLTCDVITLF